MPVTFYANIFVNQKYYLYLDICLTIYVRQVDKKKIGDLPQVNQIMYDHINRGGRKNIFLKSSKFITVYSFNSQKLTLWW